MTIKALDELKKRYCVYDDTANVIEFVSELLCRRARELEKDEPYATNTIDFLDKAAHEVWELIDYVSELEEK